MRNPTDRWCCENILWVELTEDGSFRQMDRCGGCHRMLKQKISSSPKVDDNYIPEWELYN